MNYVAKDGMCSSTGSRLTEHIADAHRGGIALLLVSFSIAFTGKLLFRLLLVSFSIAFTVNFFFRLYW